MPTDQNAVRLAKLADQRLEGLGLVAGDRPAARRVAAAMIQAEEQASATATDAQAEATAERDRIQTIVRDGIKAGKGRQALRAALLAPVGPDAARGLLASMTPDTKAAPEVVAVPAFADFGTDATQAERRRITTAFARPEAEGRFRAVAALILDGVALTGEQIAPLLAALPTEAVDPLADFQARVDEGEWFGPSDTESPAPSQAEASRSGWSKAVAEANRQIGAVSHIAAQQPAPAVIAGPFDRASA